MKKIVPVFLSGGAGSRLWPVSSNSAPKQFHRLVTTNTLLQETALRAIDQERFAHPIAIANQAHRFVVAEQLREMDVSAALLLEPVARNTAPAATVAALHAFERDPDAMILLMPADHSIGDLAAFLAAVDEAVVAASVGDLVLFGITPRSAATGYGYIELGADHDATPAVKRVTKFVEKPDSDTAKRYVASGNYVWNSGIFLLPAASFLDEVRSLTPDIYHACVSAVRQAVKERDFITLDETAFAQAPSISIDYAIMERTDKACVVPVDCGWTDVGSWSSLWEISSCDDQKNALFGDVIALESEGCYFRSEGPLIAAVGLKDQIIVATGDAVLVLPASRDQDVKKIVESLKARPR